MKKVSLFLLSLMLAPAAFSQVEGYLAIFEQVSIIETDQWTASDNRCFKTNGEIYVLGYEPLLNYTIISGSYYSSTKGNVTDKDLYIFRKDSDRWEKATSVIRHDYFHWHLSNGSSFSDSLRALDSHLNKYDPQCYGTIKIESNGAVMIELKTMVWTKGEPIAHYVYDDLILTPHGDKTYDFILKRIK